jgi:hypothetical protein
VAAAAASSSAERQFMHQAEHIFEQSLWRRRRRRKRTHDRIYNNQMAALVKNGSGTNYAEQKGMVVGQCGQFWRAVGDAIATTRRVME